MLFSFIIQLLYAAPSILLALLAFGVALAVPRWKRHALSALVALLAFGFSALVGWLGTLILSRSLFKVELSSLGKSISYVLPGLLGAWLAVFLVEFVFRKVRS